VVPLLFVLSVNFIFLVSNLIFYSFVELLVSVLNSLYDPFMVDYQKLMLKLLPTFLSF